MIGRPLQPTTSSLPVLPNTFCVHPSLNWLLTLPLGYDILALWDEESACSAFDRPPGLRAWRSFLLSGSGLVSLGVLVRSAKEQIEEQSAEGIGQGGDWSSQIRSVPLSWITYLVDGDLGCVCERFCQRIVA